MISGTTPVRMRGSDRPDDDNPFLEALATEPELDPLPALPPEEDQRLALPALPHSRGQWILGIMLALLAAAWIGVSVWAHLQGPAPLAPASLIQRVALVSLPLMLLGIVWLMFGHSPRRETERFTGAVAQMREEAQALDTLLQVVAERLEDNQTRLAAEAGRLMTIGDEAADRLGRVTHFLARESQTMDRHAGALEAAAAAARVDIGVLLHDLPRAEERASAVGAALRDTGLAAHERAGALEGRLSALVLRGREADDVVGSAAQRLGAHLARIESSAAVASERLDEAAIGMAAAVDGTMARAAEAIDQSRRALDAQGSALLAAAERSRVVLTDAGDAGARGLAERVEAIRGALDGLAGQLSAQDAIAQAMMRRLGDDVGALDTQFSAVRDAGASGAAMLSESFGAVRVVAHQLFDELGVGHDRAGALIDRMQEIAGSLGEISAQLDHRVPAALARVSEQAAGTDGRTAAILAHVSAAEAGADALAARLAEAEASGERQSAALAAMAARLGDDLGALDTRFEALRAQGGAGTAELEEAFARLRSTIEANLAAIGDAADAAGRSAASVTGGAAPALIDALLQVRETATQSAERARETIEAVIPASAAAMAEASRAAVAQAVAGPVEQHMGEVVRVTEAAVEAARKASERLTQQLFAIGEAAQTIERRIEESRRAAEEKESEALSRHVALLIESLNSTAIDVTKILSNEVTDAAWAAYLKGDRGVFTRRAVRLIDAAETREILRHYEEEPDFREHVNRYIHDFETMMRRILADRDGSPIGVTLLSSDMGKLYVALAQAIDRLRR